MDDHAELMRLRDRLHEFSSTIIGRVTRLEVEHGKLVVRVSDIEADRDKYVPIIDSLVLSNATATALAEQLRSDRTLRLSRGQLVAAGMAVLMQVGMFVLAILLATQ